MERIGLYGGSFNPVHFGHLLVAQAAWDELQLTRLAFIPAAQSPFKLAEEPAPAADRVRWLRLALAGRPGFEVDEQEIQRGGVSFTIDTVRAYRRRYPEASLFYLIGADLASQLPLWRESEALAEALEFVVIPRPGETPTPLPRGFRGTLLRGFPIGLSSSQIRERVRAGLRIDLLTPPAVAEAILNSRLYL